MSKLNFKNQILNGGGCSSPLLKVFKHLMRFPNIQIQLGTSNFNSDSLHINQALAWWSSPFETFLASVLSTSFAVLGPAVKAIEIEFIADFSALDAHAPVLFPVVR